MTTEELAKIAAILLAPQLVQKDRRPVNELIPECTRLAKQLWQGMQKELANDNG